MHRAPPDRCSSRSARSVALSYQRYHIRHATGEIGFQHAKTAMRNAFAAAPDLRFVVEDVLADGDKVALRVSVYGHPTAPRQTVPMILEIFRIANERVVEIWGAGTAPQPQPPTAST